MPVKDVAADGIVALKFHQVEALRKHMLLSMGEIAQIFGVSRVTYSGWAKGKPIRKGNDSNVRAKLVELFTIIETHEWPAPTVLAMRPAQRFTLLTELLLELQQKPE